jgi:hypothetical protein
MNRGIRRRLSAKKAMSKDKLRAFIPQEPPSHEAFL